MTAQKIFKEHVAGRRLDDYLMRGWFRMNQFMFTTHFIQMGSSFFPVVWLRYMLTPDAAGRIEKKIKKLMPPGTTVTIEPWQYSEEQEALYFEHAFFAKLPIYTGLYGLMYGRSARMVYNTYQVAIRNQGQLVGLGLFDKGENTAAGIVSMYDPSYHAHSIGKLLMYLKMQHCMEQGMEYFYPGYAVPGCPRFNYKLSMLPGFTAYFDAGSQLWQPAPVLATALPNYLDAMHTVMQELHAYAQQRHIAATVLYYAYFDAALQDFYTGIEIEYPLFLHVSLASHADLDLAVVYNPAQQVYTIALTEKLDSAALELKQNKLVYQQVHAVLRVLDTALGTNALLEKLEAFLLNTQWIVQNDDDYSIFSHS